MTALGLLGQLALPADVASVSGARRYVRDLLDRTGHAQADDAILLVSELFTNAVRHSDSGRRPGGQVTIAVAGLGPTLHIDVIDAGSADRLPMLCPHVNVASSGGRGLWLVETLATTWGWYDTPTGRVVWFQLRHPAA
ncbi:ATP-binding protein [Streptosporangium soli]|nr:ATP-binding protein [Streptosporangium sp. KLBMP 9127]